MSDDKNIGTVRENNFLDEYAETVRQLFACGRHMQWLLHRINTQVYLLNEQTKNIKDKHIHDTIDTIEKITGYIYYGDKGLPKADVVLTNAMHFLKFHGFWKPWNDYIGFYEEENKC